MSLGKLAQFDLKWDLLPARNHSSKESCFTYLLEKQRYSKDFSCSPRLLSFTALIAGS